MQRPYHVDYGADVDSGGDGCHRPDPNWRSFVRPLLAFWLRGIATSVALAVDVLFGQADFTLSSVHSAELASANSTSGHLQIAMVVLALLIAGLTAGGAFRMASGLGHA